MYDLLRYVSEVADFELYMRPPLLIARILQAVNRTAIQCLLDFLQNRFVILTKFNLKNESDFRQSIVVFIDTDAETSFSINETDHVVRIQHKVCPFLSISIPSKLLVYQLSTMDSADFLVSSLITLDTRISLGHYENCFQRSLAL